MKLYNRKELIYYITGTVLVMLLFMAGLGLFQARNKGGVAQDIPTQELDSFEANVDKPFLQPVLNLDDYDRDELENILIYEEYNDAVVNITTVVMVYNFFLEPIPQEGGSGSGAIIDKSGIVLTNNHVVKGAEQVYITLSDGTQHIGELIGTDRENDLTLLQFDPGDRDLKVIPFGNSEDLHVGQKVLAIGNPYGLERTLTTGIVSGLGRPLKTENGHIIRNMIQTDASINPGNSGGPLLDSKGNMIGINTMIYSPTGGSVGIGFAVPIDTARRVVPDLMEYGHVIRGWIDIEPVQLFPSLVRYAKLSTAQGILVSRVQSGSPAEQAGLKGGSPNNAVRSGSSVIYLGGDIIVAVNGTTVNNFTDYYSALENTRPGETITLSILRGRRSMDLEVVLTERPQ